MNKYNESYQKDGYWEYYDSNGNLRFKGNYIDGKENGCWEGYSNGSLWYKGNYIDGKRNGYWEFYHFNGNLYFKGNYIDGKRNGYWEHYDSNCQIDEKDFIIS